MTTSERWEPWADDNASGTRSYRVTVTDDETGAQTERLEHKAWKDCPELQNQLAISDINLDAAANQLPDNLTPYRDYSLSLALAARSQALQGAVQDNNPVAGPALDNASLTAPNQPLTQSAGSSYPLNAPGTGQQEPVATGS